MVETSNTAAVFSWQQTASAVAERLPKKVRSRTDEGGITVTALLAQCCFQIWGESDKGRIPVLAGDGNNSGWENKEAQRFQLSNLSSLLCSGWMEIWISSVSVHHFSTGTPHDIGKRKERVKKKKKIC